MNTRSKLKKVAATFALRMFAVALVAGAALTQAAPVVVTPGRAAGYMYFPPAAGTSSGTSSPTSACDATRVLSRTLTYTSGAGSTITLQSDATCMRVQLAGGGSSTNAGQLHTQFFVLNAGTT